ncbi:MAG: radical SAM protein [Opitutales bacterium]|nr:radical SAM protein [Opitutales bacterium]
MKTSSLIRFALYGLGTIAFRHKRSILGTIILTDKCNLHCKHCSVNNVTGIVHPLERIRNEMRELYQIGIRILFFCGGETFLWKDSGKNLRDLVIEAKQMGFLIVNIVTNGTFPLDLPEADLILLSLDGDEEHHNAIRGVTYTRILENIDRSTADNICIYMAVNQINKDCIRSVGNVAKSKKNIRAISFNFHTPYPDTEALELTREDKIHCCEEIGQLIEEGYPVFNLKSAFPYIIDNSFPTPCHQCVVMENGKLSICGRCIDVPGLCEKCGYFFAAEYALVFHGNLRVAADMLHTYLKYI